jgi:NADH-quinone oxidoreductase subunit G
LLEWSQVVRELDERFRALGGPAAVLSPHLTVEEAYLLAKYVREVDARAFVALGPVPVVGEDEVFKNGFTIRAEKCPNRRGVEEVVQHFMGRVPTLDDVVAGIESGDVHALWVTGGYKHPWIDEALAERLATVDCLIVQDLFHSPLLERATYRLPGAAFAEREGSYVNHADRLQSFSWAVRPPAGVRVEAGVFAELLGTSGMVRARRVLEEVAGTIGFFAPAAAGVNDLGLDLSARAAEAVAAS